MTDAEKLAKPAALAKRGVVRAVWKSVAVRDGEKGLRCVAAARPRLAPNACLTFLTVELNEQPFTPTLAHKLGEVPHVSGLLRRIAQLSGAGERVAAWLLMVAVQRGANHYRRDFDPTLPADLPAISDEEIGAALCLGQNPYSLDALRTGSSRPRR